MSVLDDKYKQLIVSCNSYLDQIEELKNYAYGYHVSLDCIVPYYTDFFSSSKDGSYLGITQFTKRISFYIQSFTKETAPCFDFDFSSDDLAFAEDLTKLIIFYLKSECNKADYTFLGCKKILKTFLSPLADETYNQKEYFTFWRMLNNIEAENKQTYPDDIKYIIDTIFENFDYHYFRRIADCIFYAIRFFLYETKLDYMNDQLMHIATIDMLKETMQRLSTIYENRRPRRGRRV